MRLHLILVALLGLGAVCLAQDDADRRAPRERLRDRLRDRQGGGEAGDEAQSPRQGGQAGAAVHGGKLAQEAGRVFEVVVTEHEVRVYVTDAEGKPLPAKGYAGKAEIGIVRRDRGGTLRPNHQGTSTKLGYVGTSKSKGRLRSYLKGKHSLGKADRQALRVDVSLSQVPKHEGEVRFRVSLTGTSPEFVYTCPSGCNKEGTFVDPGQCPKCEGELRRAGQADPDAGPDRPLRRRP